MITSQRKSAALRALDRRRFLQFSAGLLAVAATGCRRRKDQAYSRGSTVIVAVPADERGQPLVFLPLLALNENGDLEGRLAERWEHSSDYREWTYYLRPGVRWHDGVPVTAHDVKFSLELLAHPDILEIASGAIESIAVLNDQTVRVRHRRSTNYAVDEVHYPKHLLERLNPKQFYDWEFWNHPVGNGPYRFVRHEPQTMMEFDANPQYYRGKPKIERVVFKFAGNDGLFDLLGGSADAATAPTPLWIPSLKTDARFDMYFSYGVSQSGIYWQHRHPLFRDPQVRRALTLAIDRRQLMQLRHHPKDAPITDGPYTVRELRRGELGAPLEHDPARARELLEAAGWHAPNADSVRVREDVPFRFTALVTSAPGYEQMALFVQAQLRRVGVDMAVLVQEGRRVRERIKRGEFKEAAFDFAPTPLLFDYCSGSAVFGLSARLRKRHFSLAGRAVRGLELEGEADG